MPTDGVENLVSQRRRPQRSRRTREARLCIERTGTGLFECTRKLFRIRTVGAAGDRNDRDSSLRGSQDRTPVGRRFHEQRPPLPHQRTEGRRKPTLTAGKYNHVVRPRRSDPGRSGGTQFGGKPGLQFRKPGSEGSIEHGVGSRRPGEGCTNQTFRQQLSGRIAGMQRDHVVGGGLQRHGQLQTIVRRSERRCLPPVVVGSHDARRAHEGPHTGTSLHNPLRYQCSQRLLHGDRTRPVQADERPSGRKLRAWRSRRDPLTQGCDNPRTAIIGHVES